MTVSAQDAHPYPIYNARFRLIVPLLDADGDPVSPSSPDTELSQDLGTFADATNEATEIATSSGVIYVDLIATEMDTKSTVVRVQSTGAKTTIAVLNPRRLPTVRTGTAQAGAASTITLDSSASAIDNFYKGCWVNCTNNSPANAQGQARMCTSYTGSSKVLTIEGTWGTNPDNSTTFEVLASEWWPWSLADINSIEGVALATHASGLMGSDLRQILGTAASTPATAGILDVNVKNIDNDAASASGTVTFPNATIASTTNITAGTITTTTTATNVTTVNGLAAGVITATSIAADAITAAKVADGTIDAATFAAGAINAAAIAADAITDAKVASDVTIASVTGAVGSVTGAVGSVTGLTAATVHADLDDIQARLPAALTAGGNIKADALALSGDTVAADNAESFFDGTGYAGTNNVIPLVTTTTTATNVTTVNGLAASVITATSIATDAITAAKIAADAIGASELAADAVTEIVNGVLDVDMTGHQTQGTLGQAIGDPIADTDTIWALVNTNLNATISSRASQVSLDAVGTYLSVDTTNALTVIDDFLDTEIAAIKAKTDNLPSDPADQSAVEAAILAAWATALTEAYRGTGATGTPAQLLYEIIAHLGESSISSTTKTLKKLDGSTTAKTYTLNSATVPTSVTETT